MGCGKKLRLAAAALLLAGHFDGGEHFTADSPAPEGEGWALEDIGVAALRVHPRHAAGAEAMACAEAWLDCRRAGCRLPGAGGFLDQAVATVAAFAVLDDTAARLERIESGLRAKWGIAP